MRRFDFIWETVEGLFCEGETSLMDIDKLIGSDFSGCVLAARGSETIIQKAYGYADLPNRIPNENDTKFATASAGKVFVAVGILQLIENGALRFDTKIGDVFDFDLKKIDARITVEELLTHTSGIPDYFDENVMCEYEALWKDFPNYKIRANRDLLPLFIDKPMMYPRGSKFQYNNSGFVVLAMVIESITGSCFDQYLQKHVFGPCGMIHTGYYELDMLPAKCAVNYIYDERRECYRSNIFSVDAKGTGAGGAFTALSDIQLFWQRLMANKLLSPQMTEDMIKNHSGDSRCYGYGIWLEQQDNTFIPFFQGFDPGVSFISRYNRESGIMTAIVSNFGDPVLKRCKDIEAYLGENFN